MCTISVKIGCYVNQIHGICLISNLCKNRIGPTHFPTTFLFLEIPKLFYLGKFFPADFTVRIFPAARSAAVRNKIPWNMSHIKFLQKQDWSHTFSYNIFIFRNSKTLLFRQIFYRRFYSKDFPCRPFRCGEKQNSRFAAPELDSLTVFLWGTGGVKDLSIFNRSQFLCNFRYLFRNFISGGLLIYIIPIFQTVL